MKSYYANPHGYKSEANLGDCPLCAQNIPVLTEMVNVATLTQDGEIRTMSVPKDIYLKVVNASFTMMAIKNQRARARRFRYNRMIYKGHFMTRDNGQGMFTMDFITEVLRMSDLDVAKAKVQQHIDDSAANSANKMAATKMVNNSRTMKNLVLGLSNFSLAHQGLRAK